MIMNTNMQICVISRIICQGNPNINGEIATRATLGGS